MAKKRGKEFGEPRKRGFDDDFEFDSWKRRDNRRSGGGSGPDYNFAGASGGFTPTASAATGPVSTATVTWYNSEKGFGFVSIENNGGDAFLHASTLEATGKKSLAPGATIKCRLGQGAKGKQVSEIVSIDETTSAPASSPRSSGPRTPREGGGHPSPYGAGAARGPRGFSAVDTSNAVEIGGIVKWYNGEKGFGFINADDGGKDVFVHVSALQRSNLVGLDPEQKVRMKVVDGSKGREAVELTRV